MTGFVDKRGLIRGASRDAPVALELGCGAQKRSPEAVGVDLLDAPGVDVVGDALEVLRALPDESVSEVYSAHFLEHVPALELLLTEIGRVLRDGAPFDVVVPHFSNPYFYSDPTHTRTFGLYTFAYVAEGSPYRRGVPRYGREYGLTLAGVTLGFLSPWPVRNAFKRAWGALVNASRWGQEFYEENLVYLVPCYELRARLRRTPRAAR